MFKPIILPLALTDIKEIAHWYNERQKGLGKRFTKEVRQKIRFVCKNPKATAIRYNQTRCVILDIFPYMIHFSIDEKQKVIVVTAVFHTSQSPKKWHKR